jgi:hypothetical protein
MKALKLEGTIDHQSVSLLLESINLVPEGTGPIVIYVNSGGGTTDEARVLADYINRCPDRFEVVGTWVVSSSAFWLMAWLRCRKLVFPYVYADLHLVTYQHESREMHNPDSLDSFLQGVVRRENEDLLYWLEARGLTAEEVERIRRGGSVFLDAPRICEVTGCEMVCPAGPGGGTT